MSMFKHKLVNLKEPLKIVSFFNKLKTVLTIIALTAIIWSSIPWNSVQAAFDDGTQVVSINQETDSQDEKKPNIFDTKQLDPSLVPIDFEAKDKRTQYEKHFRKLDGTYEVALYNQAVHYLNDGKWKDIDNRLVEGENTLENKANKFKVKFPKKLDDNKQIKLKMDDYEIDWNILNINQSDIVFENNQETSNNLKELSYIYQSLKYHDIQNNVDIEYVLSGSDVKENIILNEYVSNFNLSFEYKLKNLEIVRNDDGQVLFVNENNETIFTFDKLYMVDQNNEISYDIEFQIEKVSNKTYQVTIIPDDTWLENASYPVIIDPTLKSDTTSMSIYDTYISSAYPKSKYSTSSEMKISGSSSTNQYKGLLYFNIPSEIKDKVITYSHLTLTKHTATAGRQINLYKNIRTFISSSVTWEDWMKPDNLGYDDSRVIDYHFVNSLNKYIFDITKPVKEWQAEGLTRTTGFTICDDDGGQAENSVFQMGADTTNKPVITIGYEEPAGLKDYWTYTSQDMGMLGTGYISDYTGNLTFVRNDFSMNNEFLSLSLDFFFNNYDRKEDIGYGKGWKTNFNIQVLYDSYSDKYYKLTPDGNKVYFMDENCEALFGGTGKCTSLAEDGSRAVLERTNVDGNNTDFVIKTISDIEYNFSSSGRLEFIKDSKTNHSLNINYLDLQKIDYVKDKADNRLDFIYNSDHSRIKSTELQLKQSDGSYKVVEEKEYVFDSYNNLDSIIQGFNYGTNSTMKYNHQLEYEFDSDNKLLSAYNTSNDYKIEYQYYTDSKVKKVITKDSSKLLGELNVNYIFQKTTYTDHKGKSVYYTFDNYGHTINIRDDYGYTTFYKYSGLFSNNYFGLDDEQNEFDFLYHAPNYLNNHNLIYNSDVMKHQPNPTINHGFESGSTGWFLWSGNDGNVTVTTDEAMLGKKSLKIEKNVNHVFARQELYLEAGEYTVEAWIKNSGGNPGAYIDVVFDDLTGTINKIYNTDGWVKYQLEFSLNTSKEIWIELINESQSIAYFDNVQIVEGFVDARYNLIDNNLFESYINGEIEAVGTQTMFMVGDGGYRRYFQQDISDLVTEGETYVVGGWGKADAVPNKTYLVDNEPYNEFDEKDTISDGRYFGLQVIIIINHDIYNPKVKHLTFDPSLSDWQYQMRTFQVPGDATKVIIKGIYQGEGAADFYNIQLYNDDIGTKYGYDDRGNLTNTESKGESTSIEYDENDDAIEVTKDGVTTNIERNANKQIEEVSRNNVRTTFEYDNLSNQLITTYVGYDKDLPIDQQGKWFKTSTTYTTDNQYVQSVKDEFGNAISIETDYATSLIKLITDATGNKQSFSYDEYGNIVGTKRVDNDSGDSINVEYKYDSNGRLWKIIRNGLDYEFIYNDLDQIKEVKIENTLLMSYDYLEKEFNGNKYYTDLLSSQEYGNGGIVSFEYNDENQVTKVKFDEEIRSEYEYDSSGRLAIYKDIHNGNIYFYSYDLAGRIEGITDKDGNKIYYGYDDDGNVNSYNYEIEDISREVLYHYNQTTGEHDYTNYFVNDIPYGNKYYYDEDSLRRLDNIELVIGATTIFTKQFIYDDNSVDSSMGNATNRIYQIKYKNIDNEEYTYEYTYDANHNITSIKVKDKLENIIDQYDYSYDGFNQLVQENLKINNGNESYTKYYYYDSRGNITDIKTYLYGQKDSDVSVPSYYESGVGIKMYYNDIYQYNDTYYLNVGESYSLSFKYYDTYTQARIYGMTTTLKYSNLDTSTPGYYYQDYRATDGGFNRIDFRIVFKVGNPVIPQEHLHFDYSTTWLDQLTGYDRIVYSESQSDISLQNYTYDNIGNPTKITNFHYDGHTYHHANLEYDGRQLTKITIYSSYSETEDNKVETIEYRYNDQGIRIEKTIGSQTTKYMVDGDRVLVEDNETDVIYYTYNADGSLLSMNLNGEEYFYITNLQGDIIELVDINGNTIVTYKYDAWGNIIDTKEFDTNDNEISLNVANKNPYRYRGYRYDEETSLYYLNSRYYNPEIGRYINAKDVSEITPSSINGVNLYTYSVNNPVTVNAYTERVAQVYGTSVASSIISIGKSNNGSNNSKWTHDFMYSSGKWNNWTGSIYYGRNEFSKVYAGVLETDMSLKNLRFNIDLSLVKGEFEFNNNSNAQVYIGKASSNFNLDIYKNEFGGKLMASAFTVESNWGPIAIELHAGAIGFVAEYKNGRLKIGGAKIIGGSVEIDIEWLLGLYRYDPIPKA